MPRDSRTPPSHGGEEPGRDDELVPFSQSEKHGSADQHCRYRNKTPARRRRRTPGFLSYLRSTPGWPVLITLLIFLFLALAFFLLNQLAGLYVSIFS